MILLLKFWIWSVVVFGIFVWCWGICVVLVCFFFCLVWFWEGRGWLRGGIGFYWLWMDGIWWWCWLCRRYCCCLCELGCGMGRSGCSGGRRNLWFWLSIWRWIRRGIMIGFGFCLIRMEWSGRGSVGIYIICLSMSLICSLRFLWCIWWWFWSLSCWSWMGRW